jgi:hypothetical protein
LNTLSTEKSVLNEKFESLFETDRSKDLMNELDLPISAKEVTEASSLAFKILLNSFDKQLVIAIPL